MPSVFAEAVILLYFLPDFADKPAITHKNENTRQPNAQKTRLYLCIKDKFLIESSSGSGKYEIPSYVTFDLGVNYKTKINTVPVKLSAMCYNVADKDYWMGRGGSSTFGLSMPRTFMLSATFDI